MPEEQRFLLYTKTGDIYGWGEVLSQKEGMVEIKAEEALAVIATGKPRPMTTPVQVSDAVIAAPAAPSVGMAPDPSATANRDLADQPERTPAKVKKTALKGPFDK